MGMEQSGDEGTGEESQVQSRNDMINEWWGWHSSGNFLGKSDDGGSRELVWQRREQRYRFLGQ